MAPFEKHPHRTRQMIALGITIGVALILFVVLVIIYTKAKPKKENDSGSKIKNFYTTILESGQSYFGGK